MNRSIWMRALSCFLCAWMLLGALSLFSCNQKPEPDQSIEDPAQTSGALGDGDAPQGGTEEEGTACVHEFASDNPCNTRRCKLCGMYLKASHAFALSEREGKPATFYSNGTEVYRCTLCQKTRTTPLAQVDAETAGLPILYISGSMSGISKENTVTVQFAYRSDEKNFDCAATLKWQGASSLRYDKKNYSLKLFEDETLDKKFKVDLGWGKENKYCLKANYVDTSQARNIIGARMYERVVRSRESAPERLTALPNCGVIDGFPVLIYLNGTFHGLYTFNIPKDKWMLGLDGDEDTREAIVMGDQWSESCSMRELMADDFSNGWELEHCSTDDSQWVVDSFNGLISFVATHQGEAFKSGIGEYLDVDAAIDLLIYTYFIRAGDNGAKNILWVTFDGKTWMPSMYDMDGTFGIKWDGTPWSDGGSLMMPEMSGDGTVTVQSNYSELWNRMFEAFRPEIKARYWELREEILTLESIESEFAAFIGEIPEVAYASDLQKWPTMPYAERNNLGEILSYMRMRIAVMDQFINLL